MIDAPTFDHASDVEIDGIGFRHLITTRHGGVTARTAIHSSNHSKRLGGVRFVEKNAGDSWICSAAAGCSAAADVRSLLTIPCDILVPAARTAVIAASAELRRVARENPDVIATERRLE